MGSSKSRVNKESSRVHNSGLFGIVDKAESINAMKNSEVSRPYYLNYKAGKAIREAMMEAEHRKAQAIALHVTRRIHCM